MKLLIGLNFMAWGAWLTWVGIGLWLHFPGEMGGIVTFTGTLLLILSFPIYIFIEES